MFWFGFGGLERISKAPVEIMECTYSKPLVTVVLFVVTNFAAYATSVSVTQVTFVLHWCHGESERKVENQE